MVHKFKYTQKLSICQNMNQNCLLTLIDHIKRFPDNDNGIFSLIKCYINISVAKNGADPSALTNKLPQTTITFRK